MPRRDSPNTIQNLGDLSRLVELVVDKRLGQRASAKKNRRNRHYEKQFIRNTLTHRAPAEFDDLVDGSADDLVDEIDSVGPIDEGCSGGQL